MQKKEIRPRFMLTKMLIGCCFL